jgi:cytokinin dehydrogenase
VPVPELRGALVRDEASVRWAAEDFGHLVHHRPRAVLRPGGVADVAAIVAFAGQAGLSVAARGAGHSTYGQAQAPGGIVIDMTCLSQVGEVRDGRVTVRAGARWSEVLAAGLDAGCTPPVLTDYLHTTVGGTLAVGGVGGASHRHGFQVDTVDELEVVTGFGRRLSCSPRHNRRLFDAVRAGLGQCGIITSATLRLVPAPVLVRRHRLYYSDLGTYLADQLRLVRQGRFDHLEGQVLPGESGGWQYIAEAVAHHPVPADVSLDGLSQVAAEVEDISYREFAHRLAPGEAVLRASGEWGYPHVWLNVLLPTAATADVAGSVLAGLTAAGLGNSGLVLLYPVRTDLLHAPLTRVPDAPLGWLLGLLCTAGADDPAASAAMIEQHRAVYDRVLAHGGVAYPTNTLPMAPADWRAHFGARWPRLCAARREFDPYGILTPGQGIPADEASDG